ncbi:uncharacterized protein LOC142348712 [Convolutriloba macropyga]|uniref:uncharacterized protein LOC142348712 n=1 Tax=Convolutriloba macropyga TaxID=536237 RepID=UPI003F51BE7D
MAISQVVITFACILLSLISISDQITWDQKNCVGDSQYIPDMTGFYCYELLLTEGLLSRDVAQQKCQSRYEGGELVQPIYKSDLGRLLDWAIELGIPLKNQSGFWTEYHRPQAAQMINGSLTQTDIDRRRDPLSFKRTLDGQILPMPSLLWRNESQPGNALDERDEQCTAQSRPGKTTRVNGTRRL